MKRKRLLIATMPLLLGIVVAVITQQPPSPRLHKVTTKGVVEPMPRLSNELSQAIDNSKTSYLSWMWFKNCVIRSQSPNSTNITVL